MRAWEAAQTPAQIFDALASMLLDIVNEERSAHGLGRLSLNELKVMIPFGEDTTGSR